MTKIGALLHHAMHRLPAVPAHTAHPGGHQGKAHRHHPPRVLVAWQNRIAALFGQDPAGR